MPARPYPTYPARGWPVTALLATAPAALLLGFVTGIVIATHTAAVPSTLPGSGAGNVDPASPPVGQPAPDEFWQIPDTERKTASMLPPITSGDPAGAPVTQPGSPSGVYFQGTPRDIREARLALLTDFRTYDGPGGPVSVDYQQMQHRGHGVSLVGILTVEQYEKWLSALQQDAEALHRWLEDAARRVQAAARKDRFLLAWAVVDVLPRIPEGFSREEVTPLDNGSFLVIRPLAVTVDYDQAKVLIRPLEDGGSSGTVTSGNEPWLVYSPVILFNSQDYYRPPALQNARPLTP